MGPVTSCQPCLPAQGPRALLALAAALPCIVASGQAMAQDTASADALTVIQTPGSIAKTADMAFGSIVQPNAAGTVVLTPASTATCTASSGVVRSGMCRAARFNIYGKRNLKVRIRETNGGTVTLADGAGNSMTMDAITLGTTGTTSANGGGSGWNLGRYNIDTANGITEFRLGGTLHVGAAQPAGVYHGTVLVQIQFN